MVEQSAPVGTRQRQSAPPQHHSAWSSTGKHATRGRARIHTGQHAPVRASPSRHVPAWGNVVAGYGTCLAVAWRSHRRPGSGRRSRRAAQRPGPARPRQTSCRACTRGWRCRCARCLCRTPGRRRSWPRCPAGTPRPSTWAGHTCATARVVCASAVARGLTDCSSTRAHARARQARPRAQGFCSARSRRERLRVESARRAASHIRRGARARVCLCVSVCCCCCCWCCCVWRRTWIP